MHECTYKKLGQQLKSVAYGDAKMSQQTGKILLYRVLAEVSINLNASKAYNAEDRQIRWTTYKNLFLWFNNWEQDLVDLGFAYVHPTTGIVVIPIKQLKCIVNIDATCLSLDGSNNVRGGWPEVILYNPRIHQIEKATLKSSLTSTMITRSNAAREAIIPHFQYQSKAKSEDMMRLQYDVAEHMPRVVGQLGGERAILWTSLYPDAKNMPGH